MNGGSFNLVERSGRAEQIQSSPVALERFESALPPTLSCASSTRSPDISGRDQADSRFGCFSATGDKPVLDWLPILIRRINGQRFAPFNRGGKSGWFTGLWLKSDAWYPSTVGRLRPPSRRTGSGRRSAGFAPLRTFCMDQLNWCS